MAESTTGINPAAAANKAEAQRREEVLGRLLKPLPPERRVTKPATTGSTVTIGCKVPMGVTLRLFNMVPFDEQVFGGGVRETVRAEPTGQEVTLRGPGHLWRTPNLQADEMEALQPAGYALTHGVSRDFWEKWLEQNKDGYLYQNGLIYAARDELDARAQAKDGREYKSGLEPIDPNAPTQSLARGPDDGGRMRIERADPRTLMSGR